MIRLAESLGGSAMVLSKGERDAGSLLIILQERAANVQLFERMPQMDGSRIFSKTREQNPQNPTEFNDYITRRISQDPDVWVIEVDVDDCGQFIELLPS